MSRQHFRQPAARQHVLQSVTRSQGQRVQYCMQHRAAISNSRSYDSLLLQLPLWDGATGRKIAPETDRVADAVRDALMDDAAQLADELPEEAARGARLDENGSICCLRLQGCRVNHRG